MNCLRFAPVAFALCITACSGMTGNDKQQAQAAIARGDVAAARIYLQNALNAAPQDPDLHFLNGRLALASGNVELAKSELAPLADKGKFGKEARVLLAEAYLASGQARLALDTLGDVRTSGRSFALAANAHSQLGHSQLAADTLEKGLATYPNSAELIVADAEAAITAGDLKRAKEDSVRASAIDPKDKHSLLLAGRVALIEGDKAGAERAFDNVLAQDKANPTALLAKAAIAHDRGDRDMTNALLARADQAAGRAFPQARAYMAQMAMEAGDFNRANQLVQSLPADAEMPYIIMLRGIIAGGRGQNEQAISLLQAYLTHGGEGAAARLALSHAYVAIGDKARALITIKPLADAANANGQVLTLAAQLATEQKRPEAASYQARAQAAAKQDPIGADMTAADRAITSGNWAKADTIYQRLLAQSANGGNVVILNNAALTRLHMGDKSQAVALARRAAAAAPNDPVVADTLAWSVFQQDGASAEVIALERKALAAQPGNTEIRSHAAMIANSKRHLR